MQLLPELGTSSWARQPFRLLVLVLIGSRTGSMVLCSWALLDLVEGLLVADNAKSHPVTVFKTSQQFEFLRCSLCWGRGGQHPLWV